MRLENFRHTLPSLDVDGCLIEHPTDLFYLTGIALSAGRLYITSKGSHLFVDGRYIQAAQENKKGFSVSLRDEEKEKSFLKKKGVKTLGFDSVATSYDSAERLKNLKVKLTPLPAPLFKLRMIKDKKERESLERSSALLWKGFLHLKKHLKVGVSEREVALAFEFFVKTNGATALSFPPIIAFGENSAMPHHRSSERKLKANEIVLIDIGVVVENYCSDMTRTLLPKKPSPIQQKWYRVVRAAHAAATSLCKPGVPIDALDRAAREVMRREGLESHFLHSLGHGVGLDLHEPPRIRSGKEESKIRLAAGMAITIEPGLYLPGKFGIRYEDTIVITKSGHDNLYPAGNG
jgi:Xaa-Pro aminopeptidase